MKITAVIPIRAGSQRVKNKNLRPFGDTTLLELKIDRLKEAGVFDDIVVNTDSEEAIQIAKAKGVSTIGASPITHRRSVRAAISSNTWAR